MRNIGVVALAGTLVGVAAWAVARREQIAQAGITEVVTNDATRAVDIMMDLPGFNFVRVSNMRNVDQSLVDHPQVRAMLRVIRQGESGQGEDAYRMIVGGGYFESFADHPRVYRTVGGSRTSAAGAYQITATTWGDTQPAMGLPDFSPRSQDIAALGRIAYRGALNDVLAGRLDAAIGKLRNEWTSLPGASEQNRLQSLDISRQVFAAYGGTFSEGYA